MKQGKMHNLYSPVPSSKEPRGLLCAQVLAFCSFLFDKFP